MSQNWFLSRMSAADKRLDVGSGWTDVKNWIDVASSSRRVDEIVMIDSSNSFGWCSLAKLPPGAFIFNPFCAFLLFSSTRVFHLRFREFHHAKRLRASPTFDCSRLRQIFRVTTGCSKFFWAFFHSIELASRLKPSLRLLVWSRNFKARRLATGMQRVTSKKTFECRAYVR